MLAGLAALVAQLPDLPEDRFRTDPGPYIALFGLGFLVGIFGHIVKSKPMVAVGVILIFMATIALPLVARVGY